MNNPLGRSRLRWEDNIKMNLKEVRKGGMDWMNNPLGRSRLRWEDNIKMNLKEVRKGGMD